MRLNEGISFDYMLELIEQEVIKNYESTKINQTAKA